MRFPPAAEQLELVGRGVVDFHVRAELEERLQASCASGKPLRIKAGFDPTRPDLHLGHTVLLQKMRQFQDLGHTAIFLIGDFTAMVGDPTGQNESRPRLTRDEVNRAAETYLAQAFKVLDQSKVELRRNSEWLDPMTAVGVVELAAKATVARMLERKDFAARFEEGRAIHMHEFLYPLLQGYDSVALECDVELGGTDQLFNLLVGRDLMGRYGKRPQIVMTTPILEGTDARLDAATGQIVGKKMSKSADNYIGIQEPPDDMFRKVMQIDDAVIFRFFELLSARKNEDIAALKREKEAGRNPMEIKALFGREIVERFHGKEAAEQAAREFERVYAKDAVPDDVPVVALTPAAGAVAELAWALKQAQLAASTSDARRLVEQGGVEVNGARATDPKMRLEPGNEYLVRVGSKNRRFAKIRVNA
ncbi:MAG TPA: tyrosine--tRNA ligase [Polyangiaceae bacterium]|nr:tyrosine--tRNA ligase [Polyangiaceae bacterium]